jgi:hypothetical protein
MEKKHLISLVKKHHRLYPNHMSPTNVYLTLKGNKLMSPAFGKMLTGRDVIIYSFMIPRYKDNLDLGGLYDIINYYLTAFQIVYVDVHNPTIKCSQCEGNGQIDCSECNGNREVDCRECNGSGQIECEDCGGDGYDDEGGGCSTCNGNGEVDCPECYGDGYVQCEYCDGEGSEECSECDGKGEITSYDETRVEKLKYITYHPEVSIKVEGMNEGEILSNNDYDKFTNEKFSILLESGEYYTDDSIFTDVEEGAYVFETELRNPKLDINSSGKVSIIWRPES